MDNLVNPVANFNSSTVDGCAPVADGVAADVAGQALHKPLMSAGVAGVAGQQAEPLAEAPAEDGAELLDEITEALRSHVIMPLAEAQMCALWVMHAFTIDAHQHSPRLAITSPIPNCGKTTLCSVIAMLTGTEVLSNITAAGFFRMVDQLGPQVMILDELDTFLGADRQSFNILNSGHARAGAHVVRAESTGQGYKSKRFCTWAPVVFGLIGTLPAPSLASRSLHVSLKRKRRGEQVESLGQAAKHALHGLKVRARQWGCQHLTKLREAAPEIPDCLYNRDQDNWRPLIAIADEAGGHWPQTAREIAEALNGQSEDPSEGVMLLTDIYRIFDEKAVDRLSTQALLEALNSDEDRPWHDYHEGGFGINAKQLARLLKLFGIHPTSVRIRGRGTPKGYMRTAFADAWERYLPNVTEVLAPAATSATASSANECEGTIAATTTATAATTEQPQSTG